MYQINSSTANSLTMTSALNVNKTPQTGSFRIKDNRFTYTSFSGSTLSGVSPDPHVGAYDGSVYIPLLDGSTATTTLSSANIIYSAAIDVRTVVRKYGFKPYTADTQFGATGLTFSPILTDDPQAT